MTEPVIRSSADSGTPMSDTPPAPAPQLDAHYAHCEALLRAGDRDRWLASLFAPPSARPALWAIGAFALEIGGVRARVTQPMLGEMRLRWHLDALADAAGAGEGARAHPVIDALVDTIARHDLPKDSFEAFIAAATFELYDDPMESAVMFADWSRDWHAAPLRWAVQILGDNPNAAVFAPAGEALGVARVLRNLPATAAAGQCHVPADLLARHGATPADIRARDASPAVRAALAEFRDLRRNALRRGQSRRPGPRPRPPRPAPGRNGAARFRRGPPSGSVPARRHARPLAAPVAHADGVVRGRALT